MTKNKKKYIIIGGITLAFLLFLRNRANAGITNNTGLNIVPGNTYKSRAGYTVYNANSLTAFAKTGSNANFLITGFKTVTISNNLMQMAQVTYVDNYGDVIHEWDFYLDINALTL